MNPVSENAERPSMGQGVGESTPEDLDERLDEALDETFPASDPVAVHPHKPQPRPIAPAKGPPSNDERTNKP